MNPKFSILCITYNHEKYISDFIDSVLNQTFEDFELIIIDDCSTDKTIEIAKQYDDKRIRIVSKNYNKGINDSINVGFDLSKGEYINLIASDDMMKKDYLETMYNVFTKNPEAGVIYSSLTTVDESGVIQKNQPEWCTLKQQNRFEILNKLFFIWNVLLSPGMTMRRECMQKIMPLDISLINHQDYSMHIRLLLQTETYLLNEHKILYRHEINGNTLSGRSLYTETRERYEMSKLMDNFLLINNLEMLKQIFPEYRDLFTHEELIKYYIGLLATKSLNTEKQQWGYNVIMNFLNNDNNFDLLHSLTGFTFADYLNIVKNIQIDTSAKRTEKKYKKYKKLYNIFLGCTIILFIAIIFVFYFT